MNLPSSSSAALVTAPLHFTPLTPVAEMVTLSPRGFTVNFSFVYLYSMV